MKIIAFSILIFTVSTLLSQNENFIISEEVIAKYDITEFNLTKPNSISVGGYISYKIILIYDNIRDKQVNLFTLDENLNLDTYPFSENEIDNRRLFSFNIKNDLVFYTVSFFVSEDLSDYGYSYLYLNNGFNKIKLDSIYNADKIIHSSFSSDGKYLLVNTLNTLSDYYNPEQDNRIMVYDLSEIDQGNIKKEYIPCDKCADSYLVKNTLFFTIGRKDAYDGFNNKDIYMAPWGNLEDTTKIASNTKIIAISPDGRYILGSRFFDRQKNTCVILDVISKKYQMLLGRDYFKYQAFYSYHEKMFAFDFKGYLIYIDFPESYHFDALKWRNEEIPDWTERSFGVNISMIYCQKKDKII